jgi:hypothetical protein
MIPTPWSGIFSVEGILSRQNVDEPFWFAGFGTDRLRCEQAMKTAGRENQKRWTTTSQQPSPWRGRSEQISFIQMGCEARKLSAAGEIFFLTSFIELIRQVKFIGKNANTPREEILRRIVQYFRHWKRWRHSGVRGLVGSGAFQWPVRGPALYVSASLPLTPSRSAWGPWSVAFASRRQRQ